MKKIEENILLNKLESDAIKIITLKKDNQNVNAFLCKNVEAIESLVKDTKIKKALDAYNNREDIENKNILADLMNTFIFIENFIEKNIGLCNTEKDAYLEILKLKEISTINGFNSLFHVILNNEKIKNILSLLHKQDYNELFVSNFIKKYKIHNLLTTNKEIYDGSEMNIYNHIDSYYLLDEWDIDYLYRTNNHSKDNIYKYVVSSNLRLALKIADKYTTNKHILEEYFQYALVALTNASRKYNINNNIKFSSYAYSAMNYMLLRNGYREKSMFYLNSNEPSIMNKMMQYRNIDPNITDEELAEKIKCKLDKIKYLNGYLKTFYNHSFDDLISDSENRTYADVIESSINLENDYIKKILEYEVNKVLGSLDPETAEMIKSRYGFNDGKVKSVQEISNNYPVTRERIRQIIEKELKNMKVVFSDYDPQLQSKKDYTTTTKICNTIRQRIKESYIK